MEGKLKQMSEEWLVKKVYTEEAKGSRPRGRPRKGWQENPCRPEALHLGRNETSYLSPRHADSSPPRPSSVLPWTPELHWIHHPVYHWSGVVRHTAIPGHQDHPSQWWIPVKHGVPKEHTHGQVPALQITSPLAYKAAVAQTLFNRAEKIYTDLPDTEKKVLSETGGHHHLRRTHPQPQ